MPIDEITTLPDRQTRQKSPPISPKPRRMSLAEAEAALKKRKKEEAAAAAAEKAAATQKPAPQPTPTPDPTPTAAKPTSAPARAEPKPSRVHTSVTANEIQPPTPPPVSDLSPEILEQVNAAIRRTDVVMAQMVDAKHRLALLEQKLGAILISLPEARRAITTDELALIIKDSPGTELEVLNTPQWKHHHLVLEAGRRVKPSHYHHLIGWVGKGLRLAVVDSIDRLRPPA